MSVVVMDVDPDKAKKWVEVFETDPGISAKELAATVVNKATEKWDNLLPEDLLNANYASMFLSLQQA